MRVVLWLMLQALTVQAGPTAAEIMAKVGQNQDRAEELRARYVYRQETDVRVRDSHNQLTRQERTTYDVFPSPSGAQREEVSFTGKYREGKQLVPCDKSGEPCGEGFRNEADAHIARNIRDELTAKKTSKDGFSAKLFPLTSKEQTHYRFELKGEQVTGGIPVYRIAFQPQSGDLAPDTPWAGEALISREDFEPVQISTRLAHGIPFLVRTALGTNFKGLGFTVSYRKLEEGVWFPASYGAEFDVRLVFIYSRKISVSLTNTGFERATSDSAVTFTQ